MSLRSFLNVSTCLLMVLPSFISTLLIERRLEWEFVPLYRVICLWIALSPMVFIFISGSLSCNVSLEYQRVVSWICHFYRSRRFHFRYDGPIPTRHLNRHIVVLCSLFSPWSGNQWSFLRAHFVLFFKRLIPLCSVIIYMILNSNNNNDIQFGQQLIQQSCCQNNHISIYGPNQQAVQVVSFAALWQASGECCLQTRQDSWLCWNGVPLVLNLRLFLRFSHRIRLSMMFILRSYNLRNIENLFRYTMYIYIGIYISKGSTMCFSRSITIVALWQHPALGSDERVCVCTHCTGLPLWSHQSAQTV